MKHPQILFITADELHLNTISAFGARTHITPNIDRLCERAHVYANAHTASPICLPARCCWMTGRYPHKNRSLCNHYGLSLSLKLPNLCTELKKNGYQTSLHGKGHFVPIPYEATRPDMTLEYEHFLQYYRTLGFDALNIQDGNHCSLWFYDDYSKDLEKNDELAVYRKAAHLTPSNRQVFPFPLAPHRHPDAWTGSKAVNYIEHSDPARPQFVWASFSGPHYPIDTPEEYVRRVTMAYDEGPIRRENEWTCDKYHFNGFYGPGTTEGSGSAAHGAQKTYDDTYWKHWRQGYFGNIVLIDEWIGRIIAAADSRWGKNYCVIFTADHGDMMGNHGLWGKNGSLYEDVLRVPLLVSYPGQTERVNHPELVSSLEIFPTILNQGGAAIPAETDGISLLQFPKRDYIISECAHRVAVLKDSIKLEWNTYERTGKMYRELYDLRADPHEFSNEYENPAYCCKRADLEQILREHEKKEGLISSVFTKKGGAIP